MCVFNISTGWLKDEEEAAILTLFDMGFFEPSVIGVGGGAWGPHHNFVVIALMIMKFGTGIKHDVFYTMVTKRFVTSLLLRNYDVITCILPTYGPKFQMLVTPRPLHLIWLKFFILEVVWGACFKYQVRCYFWKLLKFCYKEIYGTITSKNLEYSLTNSLPW